MLGCYRACGVPICGKRWLSMEERSEQELVRIEKLRKLRELGYPYPNDVFVNATSASVPAALEKADAVSSDLSIAGRLMTIRQMGKASFCHLQDRAGRVQIYVKRDDVGAEAYERFQDFDAGDIVEVRGFPFRTKTGEPTLHARSIRLLVKGLRPLPEKWHGLTDIEKRYRQRYVDLIVNPEVKETFLTRAKVIRHIRKFFDQRDYVEVETPMMHQVPGGANARPFVTHHNTLDINLYMRIALELPLKRLVVGGVERVYEIGRAFRNEGISTEHNPEFTMIEFYQAYATYETLMDLTEELIVGLCRDVMGSFNIQFGSQMIDYSPPWRRMTMEEAIYMFGGVERSIDLGTDAGVQRAYETLKLAVPEGNSEYGHLLAELFSLTAEEKLVNPTFILKHPLAISPLSRPSLEDPRFVDRFELFVAGMEVANAFSELNDPVEQRCRFEAQLEAKRSGDEEAMGMDDDFICALEYGLPPTAGEGIGIDRLVMLLTGNTSVRDVILFPQMRPHGSQLQSPANSCGEKT